MSTYYDYRDVKIMIAHKLMNMDGWKVYGYSADKSDSMTDYYSPANWGGVAEKNGYILCVDVYGAREPEEIRQYNYSGFSYDSNISDKITKLEAMTVDRGASEQEESTAKTMIERLQKKAETATENNNKYTVIGMVPRHMAHPSRCNWHIEKDGIIIAKGNGILKYSSVESYYSYENYIKNYQDFKTLGADMWEKENAKYLLNHSYHYETEEEASKGAKYNREKMEKDSILIEDFEKFINKLDTTCGGLLGEGDGTIYEKVTVTEYKKELKAVQTTTGSIAEGQLFILKINFNYGHNKGQIFRIHGTEYNGKKSYHAYKLNGKRTKECTGNADASNHWVCFNERFLKFIEDGSISWCELQEVKTPYEVEKVVKKTIKTEKKSRVEGSTTEETPETVNNYTYEVSGDTDTRTNEKIYLVKVAEKLSREEYLQVSKYIQSLGGYYSKFKHAFLFKENPAKLLNGKVELKEDVAKTTQTAKSNNKEKQIEKINKQLESINKKIESLSGNYETNTYKRMREQDDRETKIRGFKLDIDILQYLLNILGIRDFTVLESALIADIFRTDIDGYYKRNKLYASSDRPSFSISIKYPEINHEFDNEHWWNKEVPKKQKRLNKGGIYNQSDLLKAVEEYEKILEIALQPLNCKAEKIKKLERELKITQKGDINFTPKNVVEELIILAKIDENSIVLEPSAGIGNIADEIKKVTSNVDIVEQMTDFRELLLLKGHNLVGYDFLDYKADKKYDAIIANPPFSDEQNHIKHMYDLLKDGGTLVTICSPHWTFASDKKSTEFRNCVETENSYIKNLSSGTFEMTNVASKILIIEKPAKENILA